MKLSIVLTLLKVIYLDIIERISVFSKGLLVYVILYLKHMVYAKTIPPVVGLFIKLVHTVHMQCFGFVCIFCLIASLRGEARY